MTRLVVGLGNPGDNYASHRHNAGFMVIDRLAQQWSAPAFRDKMGGLVTKTTWNNADVVLLKPQTFMNLSGQCVQPTQAFFRVNPKDILVIHDELDLPFGIFRIKQGGGSGGHNGIKSMVSVLGTADFGRLRIGIGRPQRPEHSVSDFVLSPFSGEERKHLPKILEDATEAVRFWVDSGFERTAEHVNQKTDRKR